ncbi:hypothetical protein [Sideroxydans lithotrophicus]|uniref:Lipoprotein n=1 Tax=Sideroxydans lithotrophicus (strain ES-1) TaxID=580332 RepID=D5CTS0_SIDLE|nr:hypothetical protein [Sideroxydans lithotrophicus]ADE12232.1 hypothetical protein Slit_2004 [Sideroxydans lithotrophicus ES-1]
MKKLFILLTFALLTGCAALQHQATYEQSAPTRFPKTSNVLVFEYRNVNIRDIYDLLYGDFLIIGKSEFTGPYEDPRASIEFAKSIGADVFISASQFKETRTSFVPMVTPTTDTSYVTGTAATGPFYGTLNSYGTRTTMIPVYIDRYAQSGLYLKNVNHVSPLWEKKRQDYKETGTNPLSGIWYNEHYDLKLYRSGAQMVAFFDSTPRGGKAKETGQVGDIKMIFNPETGAGIYMMADRTPQPAEIKLNKFGNLQVDVTSLNESVSFARR